MRLGVDYNAQWYDDGEPVDVRKLGQSSLLNELRACGGVQL